jgi:hypothetical protein
MRFTTKSIAPLNLKKLALLNPKIILGKYEHPYQVEDLDPDGQVPL